MKPGLSRRSVVGQLIGVLSAVGTTPAIARARRIAQRESQYATTFVERDGDYLSMRFGINKCIFDESRYKPSDPHELAIIYTRYMTVALAYAANLSRVVEIGLGGGRIASYVHDYIPDAHITCVELDPGVVDLARRYFGIKPGPRLETVTRDGRVYMASTKQSFDIILVDAYLGTLVPFHLVTREFFGILKRRLAPGGVVAQNIAPRVLDFHRMVATARSVFDHVDLYQARNNWVLVAYDGPAKSDEELNARAQKLQNAHGLRYPLRDMIAQRFDDAKTNNDSAAPFTDDFAPVGYMDYDRKCRAGRS